MYQSTKTYNAEVGLSACFRQWRAESHCHLLHGYALAFHFVFEADDDCLDHCGWVVDFGGLKSLKSILEDNFDHTTLVADDDPHLAELQHLHTLGVARVVVVPKTGTEAFARMVYEVAEQWLVDAGFAPRARLVSVTVREHGANSATYYR